MITETLDRLQAAHPAIGDVRGRGAMMAMEIVRPGTTNPDADAARRIAQACHRAGVVVLTCGSYGNVIRLLPPLMIDERSWPTASTCWPTRSTRVLGHRRAVLDA